MLEDPKLNNFTNDAKSFIKQNADKLINITTNVNTTIKAYKLSKDLLDKLNNLTHVTKNNTDVSKKEISNELVEIEKIIQSKYALNLTNLKNRLKDNLNLKLVTVDDYVKKKKEKTDKKQELHSEKDWMNALDTLQEELDLKEKQIKIENYKTTTKTTKSHESIHQNYHGDSVHEVIFDTDYHRGHLPNMNLKDVVSAAVLPNAQKHAMEMSKQKNNSSAGIIFIRLFFLLEENLKDKMYFFQSCWLKKLFHY